MGLSRRGTDRSSERSRRSTTFEASGPEAEASLPHRPIVAERRLLPRRTALESTSLQLARKRIGRLAIGSLPLTFLHLIALRLADGRGSLGLWPDLAVIAFQIALYRTCTNRRSSAETALRRTAALTVGLAWAFSLHWHALPSGGVTYVTPIALLVVLMPLLIPLPPRLTVLAAGLAALGQPIVAALMVELGRVQATAVHLQLSFLGALVSVAMALLAATFAARSRSDLARDVGGYRLIRRLGAGGTGEVWEGRHRFLARPAAIKLLSPPTMGRSFLVRFEREAQATALLSSEHTVSLYDFGVSQNAHPYYVMELLDGFDLQRLVDERGPLHPARIVNLMQQACDSLGEAHDFGIAHRDIKPSNLFLVRRGLALDFLKVLDFGMVSVHDVPGATCSLTTLSHDGFLYGTPAYMPAEQAAGLPVDFRADLYQLGCVMFFLLTGRVVFEKRSPLALAVAHASEPPLPPSQVAPGVVPDDLERVVMRCLEKDPERRFQSARDLLAALRQLTCASQWTSERAVAWWQEFGPSSSDQRSTIVRALRRHAL